jgi:hypothetical protein
MSQSGMQLAKAYIEAVGNKEFAKLPEFLHKDVEFTSPGLATLQGAQDYMAALKRLGVILLRNDVKKTFAGGDEVCIIYNFVTDTPVGAVPSVEWLGIEDGKIKSVRLIFHSLRWPEVREEVMRRAESGQI